MGYLTRVDGTRICGSFWGGIGRRETPRRTLERLYREKANLVNVSLEDADLEGIDLHDANLRGANLRGANLHGANLCGADLGQANLSYAILTGARLNRAFLEDSDLRAASLRGADFTNARLSRSTFQHADLSRANFDLAYAPFANFEKTNLTCTNFMSAFLHHAHFDGTCLSHANFQHARINHATLRGATMNPAMMLLTWIGGVSAELCRDLMTYDAANHPDPSAFTRWASVPPKPADFSNGCPYFGVNVSRVANFKEVRGLWEEGRPALSAFELMKRVLVEICSDSDYHPTPTVSQSTTIPYPTALDIRNAI